MECILIPIIGVAGLTVMVIYLLHKAPDEYDLGIPEECIRCGWWNESCEDDEGNVIPLCLGCPKFENEVKNS